MGDEIEQGEVGEAEEISPYAGPLIQRQPRERPKGKANRLAVTALICAAAQNTEPGSSMITTSVSTPGEKRSRRFWRNLSIRSWMRC